MNTNHMAQSPNRLATAGRRFSYLVYVLLAVIPVLQIIFRRYDIAVLGIDNLLPHLLLLAAFCGGVMASVHNRHLSIGSAEYISVRLKSHIDSIWSTVMLSILLTLFVGSIEFVLIAFAPDDAIGGVPTIVFVFPIAVAYLLMYLFCIKRLKGSKSTAVTISIVLGLIFSWGSVVGLAYEWLPNVPLWFDNVLVIQAQVFDVLLVPLIAVLVLLGFMGMPLFIVLASITTILYTANFLPPSIIIDEGYRILTNGTFPAIPLFTLAGYMLSKTNATQRIINFFQEAVGWIPHGKIVTVVIASAFFTSFTGASGVTILALGGILFSVLVDNKDYRNRYATGLITSSSNLGLLFAPSLAIILYGTIAQINIRDIFVAGVTPAILLVVAFCFSSILFRSSSQKINREIKPMNWQALGTAFKDVYLELLLPVIVLVLYFSGITTLVESAAVAVLYTLVIESEFKKELTKAAMVGALKDCLIIIGGVFMILAAARGLAYFIIDANIPLLLSDWVQNTISSKFAFLIILNLILLITGCFMDIFSAILIVAPLIIPLGGLFEIHPVHLAIIFLANLGVGFITPPVGIDLFLSSFRFNSPLTTIYRSVLPFFILEFAIVLIITYVPQISLWLIN